MLHIVIINGSPRLKGSTASMLHHLQSYLEKKEDVFITYFDLETLSIATCKGCCQCFKTGRCFMNDDAEKLSSLLATADGIIIGSPTYASNVSGQLKTFIDRGHLIIEQLLRGKYALGIITSENYGARSASTILRNVFRYSGAYTTGMLTFKFPFSKTPNLNASTTNRLEKHAEKFYRSAKYKRRYPIQKWIHALIFHLGIKPFVLHKGDVYAGVVSHWATR
ncbi:MAG: flavodoxin family protein [Cellulosilyticaceae bacterium]